MEKITILTEPSLNLLYRLERNLKHALKKTLNRPSPKFAGHYAVVRSLLSGFEHLDQSYNYNPTRIRNLTPHVHVLAGVSTLKMAIRLKQQGKIKRLTAGPNIVISSADSNGIVAAPEIDEFFVNSEWTKAVYELDNPQLSGRLNIWAAGIQTGDWKIEKKETLKPVAVFYKKRAEHFVYEACKKQASDAGYGIIEIVYGNYTPESLKEALSFATVAVYFVEQESQGIALQEIWATNTPTFVWNPQIWMYKGVNYACCSAPYLTEKTGAFFRDEQAFASLIQQPITGYEPEKWVVENMTDEICSRDFIKKTIDYERSV